MQTKLSKRTMALFLCLLQLFALMSVAVVATAQTLPVASGGVFEQTQRSTDFNEGWKFHLGNIQNAFQTGFNDSAWRSLTLPHDWSIEQDFTHDVRGEVGHLPGGTGWYRKTFVLPAEYTGKRITLDFDGVYMDSNTYVNGTFVGNYPYGYNAFSYDITDLLVCDGVTENVIAVQATVVATTGSTSSRWYSGSGIYRDVNLTVTDKVHIPQYGNVILMPNIADEVEDGDVTVNVKTTVANDADQPAEVSVRHSILRYDDNSVFTSPVATETATVAAGKTAEFKQDLTAVNPLLWSTDSPNLYWLRTEILMDGLVVDATLDRFGFRWFNFNNNTGFSLNGQKMKLHGFCMHHDQGALGSVANEAAVGRQIRILKEMGANSIRVTHNPASFNMLKQCDEQGILVIDEAFDTWYLGKKAYDYGRFFEKPCTHPDAESGITWAQFDIQQMVRRGINYPSIIMWSLGNEIGESQYEHGYETCVNLKKWVKEIDTTRPVTMGEDKLRYTDPVNTVNSYTVKCANEMDVVGFNYSANRSEYDKYHAYYPDWVIYGAETASAIKSRGYYSDPQKTSGAQTIDEYQLSSYENLAVGWGDTATTTWILDRDREWVAGQFIWTGFDYIGEPTPFSHGAEGIPKSSYFGVIDTAGFPKDEYYFYQAQWMNVETDPMVHIYPHWNWERKDLRDKVTVNGKIPVRIYSNAPKVELFVDGVSQGEKSFAQKVTNYGKPYQQQSETSDRLFLEWPLTFEYKPGTTIEAKAKDQNGNVIATDKMVTAGVPAAMDLTAERPVIQADGKDLSYITVDITDANGNFMPTAMNSVRFSIVGDGKIVGMDNGDASSWERHKDTNGIWQRKVFNGKGIVIVQSTKQGGSFTLTATSPGLQGNSITVYTIADNAGSDTILGYDMPSVTTDVGILPVLPNTVNAVLADGSRAPKNVTWTMPSLEDIAAPDELTLKGVVTENGDEVSLRLTVRGLAGILDSTLVTPLQTVPELPETVTAIWTDGLTESRAVTWQPLTEEDLDEAGVFLLEGSVEGTDLTATARIRVVAEYVDVNIALSSLGTVATASYAESNGNHPPSQLNDGVINATNGWGNWDGYRVRNDNVTLTMPKAESVGKVTVWFTSMQSWAIPTGMTIDYWNGSAFVPVSSQSKTSGFTGRVNATAEYNGETITFDPVVTSRLRFNFTNGTSYPSGKDMNKITEIAIWGKGISYSSSADLSGIELDGVPVSDFNANTYVYTYGLGYGEEMPVVTASAGDNAVVFVRQPLTRNGMAQIKVVSEDGKTSKDYAIQFEELPLELQSVAITNENLAITEDDVLPLTVSGLLQDGSAVPADQVTLSYTVEDLSGHALVVGGNLLAYTAGEVSVTAHMTYRGKMIDSAPVVFTIAKNNETKTVVSYDSYTVITSLGAQPSLPETVHARFDKGLARDLAVTWDTIDSALLAEYGSFTVQGTVADQALRPSVTVVVRDPYVAQNISAVTHQGMLPDLPETLAVYRTDGTVEKAVAVRWNMPAVSTFEQVEGTVIKVTGDVELEGQTLTATASVRIILASQSENYALMRNGYDLPLALSSYANDDTVPQGNPADRVNHINDGIITFNFDGDKTIWCNWVSGTQRSSDWITVILAREGMRVERYVDKVAIGFGKQTSNLIQLPTDYFVEYYTGPIDYAIETKNGQVAGWTNSPLNNSSNWKEVEYISKPAANTLDGKDMTNVTFKAVKTNMVRVRMNAQSTKCLGVTEFEVYGRSQIGSGSFDVNAINLDGQNVLGQFDSALSMTYEYTDSYPEITVDATGNAAVTVLPAVGENGTATITILPENGNEMGQKVYTVRFVQKDSIRIDAPAQAIRNEVFEITLTSGTDLVKPVLRNENGGKMGITILSKTTDENGNTVIKLQMSIGTVGDGRAMTVYDGDVKVGSFTLDILPVPTAIQSVSAPESARVNETFQITVVTTKDLSKGKIVNESNGTIGNRLVSRVVEGDFRTAVYELAVGTQGNRTLSFLADFDKHSEWPYSKDFEIVIQK